MTTCRTTKHSEKRIKERCGCGKSAQKKVAMLALEHGIKHSDVSGSLKKYFDYLYFREQTANNIRIWGDKVFIFRGDCLITVLQLPPKYKKICDQIRSRLE